MKIEFTKMHGAGNDYIYVNTLKYPFGAARSIRKRMEQTAYRHRERRTRPDRTVRERRFQHAHFQRRRF